MKKALAIITYSRVQYFELVLPSILNQIIRGHSVSNFYDVYIFHDGLWNGETEMNCMGHKKISFMLDKLSQEIQVFKHKKNLGVALNFDFIEHLLFIEKKYDFVVFCEDDMILAPGYMSIIDMMGEKFHNDPRVGMVAAHSRNPTEALEQQRINRYRFAPMGHNWGFGLSRLFWEKRQPLVDCYLDLIRDVPYRNRPEQVIFDWLSKMGFNPEASSQDYIKSCATYALGAVKLSTFPNYGLPIGRNGLHCEINLFKQMRLDKTVVFDEELDIIYGLDDEQFIELYSQCGQQVRTKFVQLISDPVMFDRQNLQINIREGKCHPKLLVPEFFDSLK